MADRTTHRVRAIGFLVVATCLLSSSRPTASWSADAPAAAGSPRPAAAAAATGTASGATPPSSDVRKHVESVLVARSAYRALAKYDAPAFAAIVDAVASSPQAGASDAIVLSVARGYLAPIAYRTMPQATDTTAEDFARNVALEIRIVAPKQGDACFALIAPDPEGAVKVTQVDLGTLDDFDLDRIAEAIEKTATQPNPAPTRDQVARVIDPVLLGAQRRYGADASLLERLGEPGIDKNKACKLMIDLFSLVLFRQDSKGAGTSIRYLFSTFGLGPKASAAPAAP